MKKYILSGILAVIGASLTGCNDFLDDNRWPLDKQSNTPAYWSNAVNVQGQVNQLYNNFYGYGNGAGRNGTFYFESLSDDQVGRWGSSVEFNNWNYIIVPGTSSEWNSTYKVIRHINSIIQGVESGSLANDINGLNFLGQARLNRAWQYYDLVRHYGDVPLVLTVLDPTDDAILYGPRTPRNEVMDQALIDLDFAITNISTQASKTEFSRDLAYAMKAEICLYEASMARYHQNDEARAKKFYGEVISACEALMGAGYEIEPEYGTIYNSLWEAADGIPSLRDSKEVIFMKGYKISVFNHSLIKYTNVGEILGMSKDAFDNYLFLDGKPMSQQADKADEGICPVTGKDKDGNDILGQLNIKHCLAVRDKRLSATIDTCVFYNGYPWARPVNGSDMTSMSGYGVKKFYQPKFTYFYATTDAQSYTCAPLYWLAEIYLAYAEAKAELGQFTDTDFQKSLKHLYDRAGLGKAIKNLPDLEAINDQANNMGVNPLLWEIRRCRRCELMFDKGQRYWDLIRWHKLDLLDNTQHPNVTLGANVKNVVGKYPIKTNGEYIDYYQGSERKFSEREYLSPIGVDQLNLNKQLKQNEGWE